MISEKIKSQLMQFISIVIFIFYSYTYKVLTSKNERQNTLDISWLLWQFAYFEFELHLSQVLNFDEIQSFKLKGRRFLIGIGASLFFSL